MPFEFLSNLDTTTTFLLLIIFILFVLAVKKILGIIKNAIIIAVAAVLFPIVMNRFFGYDIPMDPDSIVSFILLGLGTYFVYLLAKSIYKALKFTEKFAKEKVPKIEREKPQKEEKEEKEGKEDKKESKKREKELDEREKELAKREQELQWKSKIAAEKKRKDWTKEYATLEETKTRPKEMPDNVRPAIIEPLPVIEHKRKKKKKKKD